MASKIMQCDYNFSSKVWQAVSDEAKDFVSSLLKTDPHERPTASQALRLPWMNKEFLCRSKRLDPKIITQVKDNLANFAEAVTVKKLALMIIAHRSSREQVLHLRQLFSHFDQSHDGTISYEDFKKALAHLDYSEEEIRIIFKSVVSTELANANVFCFTVGLLQPIGRRSFSVVLFVNFLL